MHKTMPLKTSDLPSFHPLVPVLLIAAGFLLLALGLSLASLPYLYQASAD